MATGVSSIFTGIFVIILIDSIKASNEFKIVETEYGSVRGILENTIIDNKPFYAFRGIPYASAPVGDLRFKAPKPPLPWMDVKDTVNYGNECVHRRYITKEFVGDEDCLFINVFIPASATEKSAVMVFIHGGGFQFGSSNGYGPEILLNNDVILVTFNYRLGPNGFLSLGTPEYSGNMGLKDQLAAIKWVSRNIEKFGGDSSKITIFGESAGSASVEFHIISPSSKGLFQRAIMQSGSILNPWAYYIHQDHVSVLYESVKKFGKDAQNIDELLEFLKTIDSKKFLETTLDYGFTPGKARKDIPLLYAPITEVSNAIEPFLTKRPIEYLLNKSKRNVDILIGFNSAETIHVTSTEYVNPELLKPFDQTFEFQLPRLDMIYNYESKEYKQMANDIRKFYIPTGTINQETFIRYNEMLSDAWFIYGIDFSTKLHSRTTNGKVFYYLLSMDSNLNQFKTGFGRLKHNLSGTSHAEDLFYLFKFSMEGITFEDVYQTVTEGSLELKNVRLITQLWTDFAKFGNPTPNNVPIAFEPIAKKQINYVNITNDGLVKGASPCKERMKFWDDFYKKYHKAFQQMPPVAVVVKDEL